MSFQRAVRTRVQQLEPFEVKEQTDNIAAQVLQAMQEEYGDVLPAGYGTVDLSQLSDEAKAVLDKRKAALDKERQYFTNILTFIVGIIVDSPLTRRDSAKHHHEAAIPHSASDAPPVVTTTPG